MDSVGDVRTRKEMNICIAFSWETGRMKLLFAKKRLEKKQAWEIGC